MTENRKKKVIVMVPPATGHVNPMCGLVYELCKNPNIEVTFYSNEQYRGIIEKTGAKFRPNAKSMFDSIDQIKLTGQKMLIGDILNMLIQFSYEQLPQLMSDVEKEKPDLILFDGLTFPVKYLLEIIKARNANGDMAMTLPKTVFFAPNFAFNDKMIQIMQEQKKEGGFWSAMSILNSFRKQFVFSWYYGIPIYNPLRIFQMMSDTLNIVAVNPELQPFRDEFNETFKFVGSCVSEETRVVDLSKEDPELKSILDEFDQNPDGNKKLVFMSLGSVFHAHFYVFEKAVEAFLNYDKNEQHRFKLSDLKIIISVGGPGLEKFNEKIANGEMDIPTDLIMFRAKVAQLEVLKRASLFITHCGMNSTLETIKYAVPIIGIPLDAEQPLNASRVCDELNFGVQLDPVAFTPSQFADSVDQVLSEAKYKESIEKMSKISANYNGAVEGARLITEYLYN